MGVELSAITTYLPKLTVTNEQLCVDFPDWNAEKIEDKLGIKQRCVAAENETSSDMGYAAANELFRHFDRETVDFLLFCTQSPDYFLPTSACILQEKLGLSKSTGALDFNLGCSGFIYGLALAKGLVEASIAKNVLLITAETYSKFIHPRDRANRSIFGDGACAALVKFNDTNKIFDFDFGTDGSGFDNLIVRTGGMRNRDGNPNERNDEAGNIISDGHLYMNGPEIFNFTIRMVPETISRCLTSNNLSIEEIDYFIFHQANEYMLNHLRKKLKIPAEKFYQNMKNTGNTVSSTIPFAIKDAVSNGLIQKGNKVLLCGFGVGYSWGTTIIEI